VIHPFFKGGAKIRLFPELPNPKQNSFTIYSFTIYNWKICI
jgi:hypothetical protein